ncbi:unnamed protein product [Pleuronectes platessa]|uniref:Uncharacterized protein n=1 Tax=Pleuronectes platessa TaxID=8262 RepID=A0A9N7TJT6_PLEPL|nr:unnamed protein product [Pleuronectes platessa]
MAGGDTVFFALHLLWANWSTVHWGRGRELGLGARDGRSCWNWGMGPVLEDMFKDGTSSWQCVFTAGHEGECCSTVLDAEGQATEGSDYCFYMYKGNTLIGQERRGEERRGEERRGEERRGEERRGEERRGEERRGGKTKCLVACSVLGGGLLQRFLGHKKAALSSSICPHQQSSLRPHLNISVSPGERKWSGIVKKQSKHSRGEDLQPDPRPEKETGTCVRQMEACDWDNGGQTKSPPTPYQDAE